MKGRRSVDRGPFPDHVLARLCALMQPYIDAGWSGDITFQVHEGTFRTVVFPPEMQSLPEITRRVRIDPESARAID